MNVSTQMIDQLAELCKDKHSLLEAVKGRLSGGQDLSKLEYDILLERSAQLRCKGAFVKLYSQFKAMQNDVNPNMPPYIVYKNGNEIVSAERLADYIADTEHYIFVRVPNSDEKQLYWYDNGVYRLTQPTTAKGYIKRIIREYNNDLATVRVIEDTFKQLEFNLDNHLINDCGLLDDAENIIVFKNGVLKLDTMSLEPHSSEYLSTIQIPCKWNSAGNPTPIFDRFIDHLARGEAEAKQTLMEFIGFTISNVKTVRFKKSLWLIGAGNSGKSQFVDLLERFVGVDNCCTVPFHRLEDKFQLANLYRKRLGSDKDCRSVGCSEMSAFKFLVAGDQLQAEPKHKMPFFYHYRGAYIVNANELPKFGGDRGEHVYQRILPIQCGDSIPISQQDKHLIEKLYAEREGIVYKCIQALRAAIGANYVFTEGENTKALRERYKIENDIVLKFVSDCCEDTKEPQKASSTAQVWLAFKQWCKQNNEHLPARTVFTKSLCRKYGVKEYSLIKKSGNTRYYPCTLTDDCKNEYGIFDSISED